MMVSRFNRQLPAVLDVLWDLAKDLHWSWNHASDAIWQRINCHVWQQTQNPVTVLQLTGDEQFTRLAQDESFMQELHRLIQARQDYMTATTWYQTHYANAPVGKIAYFSMEFGLCEALPIYAGGLGLLAGDYLKTASDLGVPVVGVGLLYQEGYFRQSLNSDGWQQESYLWNDPSQLPIQPLLTQDGDWLYIDTEFLSRQVSFRVWQAQVGRTLLYLLDSNDPCNQPSDRSITNRLYGGGSEQRLVQEMALGIGGWRLIETLGLEVSVCHLNEGHAAFATLERIRNYCQLQKVDFWTGLWATRIGNLFTTHTPVAAGFDQYDPHLLRRYIGKYAQDLGISIPDLLALGQTQQGTEEPFNMAYLAMRTCAHTNGVSRLHGSVSRRIFQPLFTRWPEREVPVGYITNGVHVPSWNSPSADDIWTDLFGKDRWRGQLDTTLPVNLNAISDAELWQLRTNNRAQLIDFTRQRLAKQNRVSAANITQQQPHSPPLSPDILTLGFARRSAEYKRTDLLLRDAERLARLLNNTQYPVQLLVAGKAHPADDAGKLALQHWHAFVNRSDVRHRVVFLEDYDIALAQKMVQGVDVWINTPRRPWEACGTSGMKVLVNGGLNLSSLDGWWAEAFCPDYGWALGDGLEHRADEDNRDAEQLYQLLEQDIVPLYYTRNGVDLPTEWLKRVRASMATLTTRFSSNRMLHDYLQHYYLPAASGLKERTTSDAHSMHLWQQHLRLHWHDINVQELHVTTEESAYRIDANIYLGAIKPDMVRVQIIADPSAQYPAFITNLQLSQTLPDSTNYTGQLPTERSIDDFTLRIIGAHPQAQIPAENPLIYWHDKH